MTISWSRVAPDLPSGTRISRSLVREKSASSSGLMTAKGTSTRLASLDAVPTSCSSRVASGSGGVVGSDNGQRPSFGSSMASCPSRSRIRTAAASSDSRSIPGGSPRRSSARMMVKTPHRGPLARIEASRAAAASLKAAGKSAMTRNR